MANVGKTGDTGSILGLGRSLGVGNENPLRYSCLHGQRNLAGYSPWGLKESDMTERLHFLSLSFLKLRKSTLFAHTFFIKNANNFFHIFKNHSFPIIWVSSFWNVQHHNLNYTSLSSLPLGTSPQWHSQSFSFCGLLTMSLLQPSNSQMLLSL